MKKHTLKLSILAIASLFAAASCKKDKDKGPDAPNYLPVTIYVNGRPADSLTYNSKNLIDRLYARYGSDSYAGYYQFDYNSAGNCVRVRTFESGIAEAMSVDTLVYSNNSITVSRYYTESPGERIQTNVFQLKNDRIVFEGSKDTVVTGDEKRVYYTESTFTGDNLSSLMWMSYRGNTTSGMVSLNKTTLTYTFDTRKNGLQWLFTSNPYAGYLLNNVSFEIPIFNPGKNNMAGLSISNNATVTELAVANTYDAASGFVATQAITVGTESAFSLAFRYTKR
jgi:hypothetical protein